MENVGQRQRKFPELKSYKRYRSSVVVQATRDEILTCIVDFNFISRLFPTLSRIDGEDADGWKYSAAEFDFELKTIDKNSYAWQLAQSDHPVNGLLTFKTLSHNRGTIVSVVSNFSWSGDTFTSMLKKIFTNSSEYSLNDILKRLKTLIETGEIPTTYGQPHGSKEKSL